jgi:hypothetical protein
MLMLAGLAYYQGHEDPTAGQQEVLIGTALPETDEKPEPDLLDARAADCEKRSDAKESEPDHCLEKDS